MFGDATNGKGQSSFAFSCDLYLIPHIARSAYYVVVPYVAGSGKCDLSILLPRGILLRTISGCYGGLTIAT